MSVLPDLNACTVGVIGLGYVGLPLAVAFATPGACFRNGTPLNRRVIGFDINSRRLEELRQGIDRTKETSVEELQAAQRLEFTSDSEHLTGVDVFVVTVPTPIDSAKRPDLTPLKQASATVGRALKLRAECQRLNGLAYTTPVVIYEARFIPGLQKRYVWRSWRVRAACASTLRNLALGFAVATAQNGSILVIPSTGLQPLPR